MAQAFLIAMDALQELLRLHLRVIAAVVEDVHARGDEDLLEVDAPVECTVAHDVANVGDELC